jgi:hypothetical protein
MRHLGEALDTVRKNEYSRVAGRDRRYIKGQKYTLLSRWRTRDTFCLRSIPEVPLLPRNTVASIVPTPSNHLAYFDTLGEVHEFLTSA